MKLNIIIYFFWSSEKHEYSYVNSHIFRHIIVPRTCLILIFHPVENNWTLGVGRLKEAYKLFQNLASGIPDISTDLYILQARIFNVTRCSFSYGEHWQTTTHLISFVSSPFLLKICFLNIRIDLNTLLHRLIMLW